MSVLVDRRRRAGWGRLLVVVLPIVLALAAWAHDWHLAFDADDCAALVVCGAAVTLAVALPLGGRRRRVCRRRAWRQWRRMVDASFPPAHLTGRTALERLVPMLA
jgi:hypothetical protein